MKKHNLCIAMAFLLLSITAKAEDYLMPKFAYEEKTISAGETITFYDFNGEDDIPSSSSSNSYATVVFRPAASGYAVKVHFDYIEMQDDGSGWISYFDIFNGVFDKSLVNGDASWPSTISSATSPAPFKTLAEPMQHYENCDVKDVEFMSSDLSGALSFCFHYRYAKKIKGWKAVVTTEKMEDMTLVAAGADYNFVDSEIWSGKQQVALGGLHVLAEGSANPHSLTEIRFSLTGEEVIDVATLGLYDGQAANVGTLKRIDATIAKVGNEYVVTMNKTLVGGENKFCLGADILSTASFGAKTSINISSIKTTNDSFTGFTTANPTELTVAAMYIMTGNATYDIDEESSFYDDGGKNGNISEGFEGKVVFRPSESGKKVKLVFHNIHLFYSDYAANSSGLVDWLYVYNGNSEAEDDLLFQVRQSDYTSDIVIKSTAVDGSLTVVHRSRANSSNLKSGWEATVSQFVPQAMHVVSVESSKFVGTTVAAGQQGVEVARVKITTEETEPQLVVKQLELSTNNSFGQISAARLYYTKDNSYSADNLLGEVAVGQDKVAISAGVQVNFREGDNYLWIVYDIDQMAVNEQKVDIILEKVVFTNLSEYSSFTQTEGSLTVENKAVQDCGKQSFKIQGEWQYTHTVASEYSSSYKAQDCEQTVIFRPMTNGNLIQIDYQDFDVYYSSSSYYGTKAKYVIYAGEGTSGDKLWELDSNGKQPTTIRSTAADGAVTIVFNANTTSSYYTGNGWHATVREYTPQQMSLDKVVVEQASTKLVKLGEEKAPMLNFDIQTIGMLNPLSLSSVIVSLKGTEQNVDKVYLLQEGEVLAEASAAATVQLVLSQPKELQEYKNIFSIAFDIKQEAVVGQFVDAALIQIATTKSSINVDNGDPEGAREIKNVMLLQAGDNGTVEIGSTPLMLYDDGGDENYTANMEGYVTFKPQHTGYAVELVFKDFDIAYLYGSDPFNIYFADAYSSSLTADKSYGYYSKPEQDESVISAAADGSMTIYVKMPSNIMKGFEVEVREHLLTDLHADSVVVTSLAPVQQTKGSTDHLMLQMALYVSGDRHPITIDGVNLDIVAPLTNVRLYTTAQSPTFTTATPLRLPYSISERGVYYFWAVADIADDALVGDEAQLILQDITIAGQILVPTEVITAGITVVSGMHGYYQIGSSYEADYPSLGAALKDMTAVGLDGATILALENGTYTEAVLIPQIQGAGAGNTLTIRSVSGNTEDVVLQYEGQLSSSAGVMTIDGADYLTLKDLTLTSTSTGNQGGAIVVVRGGANNITIDNCRIYTERYTETSNRLDLVRLDASDNNYNNNFTLKNSSLEGGYVGLYVIGHKAAADVLQQGLIVENNSFRNQGSQMIYGDAVHNVQIVGNSFRAEAQKSSFAAVDWILFAGTFSFAGNDILITTVGNNSAQPFYLRPNSYQDKSAQLLMYNNVINVESENDYASYCANFNSNLPLMKVAYNTMVMTSHGMASSPFYMQSAPTEGSVFVNNIFQTTVQGYAVRYKNTSAIGNISYENNILYTPQATFGAVAAVDSFDKWQTEVSAADKGNMNEQVAFASATLLLPRQTNEGHLLTAQVLDWVSVDITGKQRSQTPTIGAYEYDEELFRVPKLADGYPKVQNIQSASADLILNTDNLGTARLLVLPAMAEVPSIAQVLASESVCTLAKERDVVYSITNLEEETSYKAYIVLLSPLEEPSETMIVTEEFTTLWQVRPIELQTIENQTVASGATIELKAVLAAEYEQARPYTYKWYTAFSDATLSAEATLSVTATQTTEYICKVTDKYNQTAYLTTAVSVLREAAVAGFEEYRLASGEKKYVEEAWTDAVPTWLYSGTYGFANTPDKLWGSFSGFAISADQSADYTGNYMIDQFRSVAGGAAEGNNFAIGYYSAPSAWFAGHSDTIIITNSTEAHTINGFYITNTTYTADAVLNGDYSNPRFGVKDMTGAIQKDYLKLTVYGYNNGVRTDVVDYYLADYQDEDSDEHYLIDTWQWVDLSPLGAVTEIRFEMFTTKQDDYGFTTPTYFAFDNFGAVCPIDTLPQVTVTSHTATLNLNDYFSHEEKGRVVYSVTDERTHNMTYTLSNGILQLNATSDDANAGLTICHIQRGKRQYKYLPVRVSISTDTETLKDNVTVFPTILTDYFTILTDARNCQIQVFAADGRPVISMVGNTHNIVNTSAWPAGQYVVRVATRNGVSVTSVIKR